MRKMKTNDALSQERTRETRSLARSVKAREERGPTVETDTVAELVQEEKKEEADLETERDGTTTPQLGRERKKELPRITNHTTRVVKRAEVEARTAPTVGHARKLIEDEVCML
jgi:hypothetical protein